MGLLSFLEGRTASEEPDETVDLVGLAKEKAERVSAFWWNDERGRAVYRRRGDLLREA
jgi:hypothetical protein